MTGVQTCALPISLFQHNPNVIVLNGGDNQFAFGGQLVMNKKDIYEVHKAVPNASIIVVHMEGVNHHTLTRKDLKQFLNEKGITDKINVPEDGQSYTF